MDYAKKVDTPSPPMFLLKTYMMVDDPTTDGIISWNMDGSGFVVWRLAEFARDLLPTIFKHCNFASFVRQLNTYEFHKVSLDRWEFSNRLFRRGAMDQLHEICRKKPTPNKRLRDAQLPRAPARFHPGENGGQSHFPSASMQYGVLADENRRLQQEKDALSSELFAVKKRFDKLLDLATDYGQSSESEKKGPKIFGVRLGIRR